MTCGELKGDIYSKILSGCNFVIKFQTTLQPP